MDPIKLTRSYDFRASLVMVSRIRKLESLGYFGEGSAREPREETVPEANPDKAVVFKDFFVVGLWMRPHPAFTEILLKFRVQLHQMTPNAIAQMSKYFLGVLSCGGEPSSDGFSKHCEKHYQPNKIAIDGFEKFQQFSVINFHDK
jgi:hypothetical protein